MNPQRRTTKEIDKFLKDYKATGLSKKQYCLSKKIPYTTFIGWFNRKKDLDLNKSDFISLSVQDKFENVHSPIGSIREKNTEEKIFLRVSENIELEFCESVSPSWVIDILKGLV